ncbi:hypothetical protein [Streptomyces canus]|nr:hypothetical protein [Streptomyces canus]
MPGCTTMTGRSWSSGGTGCAPTATTPGLDGEDDSTVAQGTAAERLS